MKRILLILFIFLIPKLIYSMCPEPMDIVPTESNILQQYKMFPYHVPEIKLEILAQSFRGIVDPNKSAEENIKKLFDQRAKLMRLSPEIKELVSNVGKIRILQEIGNQLSKLISKDVQLRVSINYPEKLVEAVSNFANDEDVIKALTYVKDVDGFTLMHQAAFDGDVNAVKILKEAGADVNAMTQNRDAPLGIAAVKGHIEAVKKLIEFGANINEKDDFDYTALHHAIYSFQLEIVDILVNSGADINAKNKFGDTPLDAATDYDEDIEQYLIDHGAKHGSELP